MTNTAVILCAGKGRKIAPYSLIRSKVMIPVSNIPIVAHNAESLRKLGFEKIIIVTGPHEEEIKNYFQDAEDIEFINDTAPKGTASSLALAAHLTGNGTFLAVYGDTIIDKEDLKELASCTCTAALIDRIRDGRPDDYIGCTADGGFIDEISGHSEEMTHFFAAFSFTKDIYPLLNANPGRFTQTDVGMMSPGESFIEMTLCDLMSRGEGIKCIEAKTRIFDIDKPWQILVANREINTRRCSALTENETGEGSFIDDTAIINGHVKLGKNSFIGKNAIIEGNIIVGDNTKIFNGAIVQGNTVIGSRTAVRNACFVSEGSTVGDDCIVSHASELEGIIFRRVYLYHYMEIYGIIGENTDIGAATVCGSMRFDNSFNTNRTGKRREFPEEWGNATFIGDYCRTGVNAIMMPGVKVGSYGIVGPGVVLRRDLPDHTIVTQEQNLTTRPWSEEIYGW